MQKHAPTGSHLAALGVALSRLSRSINGLEAVKPDTVRMVGIGRIGVSAVFPPVSCRYDGRLVTNTDISLKSGDYLDRPGT